jgi:biotin carboxyl carrier protein
MRLVIMRVLDGGEGWINGGRSERSRESGDLEPEEARERKGEDSDSAMVVAEMAGTVYSVKVEFGL